MSMFACAALVAGGALLLLAVYFARSLVPVHRLHPLPRQEIGLATSSRPEKRRSKKRAAEPPSLVQLMTRAAKAVGQRAGPEARLVAALDECRDLLLSRNVALSVADAVCLDVRAGVAAWTSARAGSLATAATSWKSVVAGCLAESLRKVLASTPTVPLESLVAAHAQAQASAGRVRPRPYTIVFVGVNGVGKSTSLAKVAWYLEKRHGLGVVLVAADTFRSGAIEQLKTHAAALGVPLHSDGYNRDAASVALRGVMLAAKEARQVVLVDTAGRTQNNTALMRSLNKLLDVVSPDLILYVGDALAGNDAAEQVAAFDRTFQEAKTPRRVQGIILTKTDTVGSKIGAALSVAHVARCPLLFLGTGQNYDNLELPDASKLVATLLQ